jgi:hypothetical protein
MVIVVMYVLSRKGYIHPAGGVRSVQRAVSQRVRNTRGHEGSRQGGSQSGKMAYDVRHLLKLSK